MNRPHYKAMYLEAQQKLDETRKQLTETDKALSAERYNALVISRERATYRQAHHHLKSKVEIFLQNLHYRLLDPAAEKNGWLVIPMLQPYDAQYFLREYDYLVTYVKDTEAT